MSQMLSRIICQSNHKIFVSHITKRSFSFDFETMKNLAEVMKNPKVLELMKHPATIQMFKDLEKNPEALEKMKKELYTPENIARINNLVKRPEFGRNFDEYVDKSLKDLDPKKA